MNDATVTQPLEEVAHSQTNVLFDVIALLEGASAVAINASSENPLDPDVVLRIIDQAKSRTKEVIAALTPYI